MKLFIQEQRLNKYKFNIGKLTGLRRKQKLAHKERRIICE